MSTSQQTARDRARPLRLEVEAPRERGQRLRVRQGWKQPSPGNQLAQSSPEDGPSGMTGALKRTRAEKTT